MSIQVRQGHLDCHHELANIHAAVYHWLTDACDNGVTPKPGLATKDRVYDPSMAALVAVIAAGLVML